MTAVSGPGTYDVKDQLRKLGGKWNPALKAWVMPNEAAYRQGEELRSAAAAKKPARQNHYHRSTAREDYEDFGDNTGPYGGF